MVHEWRVNHACAVVNATTSVRGVPCNLGICRMGILAGTSAAAFVGMKIGDSDKALKVLGIYVVDKTKPLASPAP